jgi:hypothetical protein
VLGLSGRGLWNTGCAHHNTYEQLNGNSLTHTEVSGHPGDTTDGAAAGSNSVIANSFSFPNATPVASLLPGPTWDGAVFHRAALLDPRLAKIGFDSQTVIKSKTVSVATSTVRIAGSNAHAVHFSHAEVFIDRGIKHVRHHSIRRHGRTVRTTTVSYGANRTIGTLPGTITLKLATLSSGSHGLRVVFTFHRTVRKNGRSHTVSSTGALSTKFRVC